LSGSLSFITDPILDLDFYGFSSRTKRFYFVTCTKFGASLGDWEFELVATDLKKLSSVFPFMIEISKKRILSFIKLII
jgi:hypothetical protein